MWSKPNRLIKTQYVSKQLKMAWAMVAAMLVMTVIWTVSQAVAASPTSENGEHLVSIYDRGEERTILTRAATVRQALEAAGINVDPADVVEPGLDDELIANTYHVNVYRARPVVVADGVARKRVMTAEQSPRQIARAAAMTLYDEDNSKIERVDDVVSDGGAGLKLVIDRATPFQFTQYGKNFEARTQATTVGEMLKEKGVVLGANDGVSVPLTTPISTGMSVAVWRNGKQTVTQEEVIAKPIEEIKDTAREVGFREVKSAGTDGKKQVTYEIEMRDGVEVSRKVIVAVVTLQPVKEVVTVGAKSSGNPLTKSKGVNTFVDSKGVAHRETYYDLPMSTVMGNCGAGGVYSVRADGVKVDPSGYVIVAAHLGNYPRCSLVETSVGMAKVYDTGGFTSAHPHGIDIATDWTNYDGR